VTAFERDARRFKTLEKMLDTANCKNVTRVQGDFTQSKPTNNEWSGVTHM
jgi:putative methyltransferase